MRKLTGAVFLSLDGVMQAPGGPDEDPTSGFRSAAGLTPSAPATWARSKASFRGEYDLLLGRRTYDIFAAYWPHNRDNPIGEKFQRINKYVLTHSDQPLDWDNSSKLSGDAAAAVAELKQSEGRDLLIQGSSTLYPPLLSAGLIDRLVLMTFPVLLGKGKSIFDGQPAAGGLKLTDHHVSGQGVIIHDLRAGRRSRDRQLRDQGAKRRRARAAREDQGRRLVSLQLFGHPFSSLYAESPDRAVGGRDAVRLPHARPGSSGEFRGAEAAFAVRAVPAAAR